MKNLKTYDIPFEGTTVHCHEGGSGVPIVLLHGSGAGVRIPSNFKTVSIGIQTGPPIGAQK